MTHTQQPEALNLEEFRAKVTRAAREPLLVRIAELEEINTQLCEQADVAAAAYADLQAQLVKEAARTAEEKLRANQMSKQHDMQAKMHQEAVRKLTTNPATAPVGYVALAALTSRTHADDYAKCFATEAALLENYPAAKAIAVFDHATHLAQQGLEQFIEQLGDVHFQRCRVGPKEGEIRWDIEFGHYGAEVRGKTLQEAIAKAMAAQTKKDGKKK